MLIASLFVIDEREPRSPSEGVTKAIAVLFVELSNCSVYTNPRYLFCHFLSNYNGFPIYDIRNYPFFSQSNGRVVSSGKIKQGDSGCEGRSRGSRKQYKKVGAQTPLGCSRLLLSKWGVGSECGNNGCQRLVYKGCVNSRIVLAMSKQFKIHGGKT